MANISVNEPIMAKNTNNSSTTKFENPTKLQKCGPLRKLWNFLIGWFRSHSLSSFQQLHFGRNKTSFQAKFLE